MTRSGFLAVVVVVMLVVVASPAVPSGATPEGRFVSYGPFGGVVEDLAIDPLDPSVLFAATSAGLFRTGDGGRSWRLVWEPVIYPWVRAVAMSAVSEQIVYAGGFYDGTHRSDDGGRTWLDVDAGNDGNVSTIAVDPTDPHVVLVGKTNGLSQRSVDGGETWGPMHGLDNTQVWGIEVAPSDHLTVYAASEFGVFQSLDGGANWIEVSHGVRSSIDAVGIDPSDPDTVFASNYQGVWRTEDGAASWSLVGSELANKEIAAIAVDPNDPGVVYAASLTDGMYRSLDRGETWSQGETPRLGIAVVVDPLSSSVYSGTSSGVYRSDDRGVTWRDANRGLTGLTIESIAISASDPRTIYVGTFQAAVYRSDDRGHTWVLSSGGIDVPEAISLAVDPTDPMVAYVVTRLFGDTDLLKTVDGGSRWVPASMGIDIISLSDVAADPFDPMVVYATDAYRGLYRSTDGAESWSAIDVGTSDLMRNVTIDPADPAALYVLTDDHAYQSLDAGATWASILAGSLRGRVVVDPTSSDVLYVLDLGGVQKSSDRGATWTLLTNGLENVDPISLALDPAHPDTLYVGASDNDDPGVYRSGNGGLTFSYYSRGLPRRSVTEISVAANGTPFVGLDVSGLYVEATR